MSETRERIAAHVRRDPGVHFSELVRALDLAPGQVQYHLKKLDVVAADLYGQTHYFPDDYDAWDRGALALLRRETAADVVSVLMADGPLSAGETAERAGIARSTLSWHLDRLVEQELVEKRYRSGRVHLVLAQPERTAELLDRAEPTLPGRLVDRFTRLVDALLEE
ncbi:winged helix-turn-helix transcriptional regulator [Halorarius halobius]|uniref:winged helix-turn-helix transcriptional regulator n=1 Tax=Halorarius halobius TaxID=2962671 RepID=UPI0020CCC476|nr:helix-turn-helix domain-containing protein [Halorarius halobius]